MKLLKSPRAKMIVSMAIFGTIAPFVRSIAISSGELAMCRAILAILLIGVYIRAAGMKISLKAIGRELPLLAASGIAMGINWVLLFEAYKYTTVSVATLSYYFAPVIVTAVCPILFKEKLTRRQVVCFAMSTLGLVLVTGLSLGGGSSHLAGVLYGLGAAVFYAAVILMNKLIRNVEGVPRTFLQFTASLIVLVPYVACTGGLHLELLDASGWVCLLIVGLMHTGVTYCLYFSALRDLPGQKAAILSYIDPLVAVVISLVILGEPLTVWQAIGGALILGFTLANELGEKPRAVVVRRGES